MKLIVMPDLGCAYRWSDKYSQLEWCPLYANNVIDTEAEEWGCVDEDIVGEEKVMVDGRELTLSQVYRDVEYKLGVS